MVRPLLTVLISGHRSPLPSACSATDHKVSPRATVHTATWSGVAATAAGARAVGPAAACAAGTGPAVLELVVVMRTIGDGCCASEGNAGVVVRSATLSS